MVSDSIPNATIASSNPRDFTKKKRGNWSAKLKQCKLDARREQWLSQVKNKGECKEEVNLVGVACSGPSMNMKSERIAPMAKVETKARSEEGIYGDGCSIHHYSDSESLPSNSPTSYSSSVFCSNDSVLHLSASSRTSSSSGRSSSSFSNGFCSGNISDEDEGVVGDDDCLDDWEAMADALAATDNKKSEHNHSLEKHENPKESNSRMKTGGNYCAWRPDDACRPQSLPNLVKQYSFPSERHLGLGSVRACKNSGLIPTSCPICFEDLDCTDTSFFPCTCGFRLCLFCHNRILEEDGRCPGCRKPYKYEPVKGEAMLNGGSLTFQLARSSSMITRS